MIVVGDTSPITNLHQIGQLQLLADLFGQVIIPPGVESELRAAPDLHADPDWTVLRIHEVAESEVVATLSEDLGRGEAEAIALAMELGADLLLIDESAGREQAARRGIQITGLLGVLLQAKRTGLISSARAELESLANTTTFWVSGSVRGEFLRLCGEDDE